MPTTSRLPFDRLDAALDQAATVDPIYLTTTEKQDALTGWSRVIGRAQAQQLRVLAAADDIADQTGDRSTAHWLADRRPATTPGPYDATPPSPTPSTDAGPASPTPSPPATSTSPRSG